jgi:hypothetical protein
MAYEQVIADHRLIQVGLERFIASFAQTVIAKVALQTLYHPLHRGAAGHDSFKPFGHGRVVRIDDPVIDNFVAFQYLAVSNKMVFISFFYSPMTKIRVAFIVFALLAFTVPWWWIGSETDQDSGLAAWIVYAFVMNVVFAVTVAWLLKRHWATFAEDDDSHAPPR